MKKYNLILTLVIISIIAIFPYATAQTCVMQVANSARIAQLSWTYPGDILQVDKFNVLRGTTASALTQYMSVIPGNLSFTDSEIKPGKTYYYTVNAQNAYGTSPNAGIVCKTFLPEVPQTPATIIQ